MYQKSVIILGIIFLFLLGCNYYSPIIIPSANSDNTDALRQGIEFSAAGRRRQDLILPEIPIKLNHLNPERYRKSNGCDFSGFVERFKPDELEINCKNIHQVKIGKLLGSGSSREVYEGEWRGRKLALKMLREARSKDMYLTRCTRAAAVLFQLREVPNVSHLVGWCNTTIVLDKAVTTLDVILADKDQEISVTRALEMALDIAKAVEQIHSVSGGPVVHNDIKPEQYLIDEKGKISLSDFDWIKYAGNSNDGTKCKFQGNRGGLFRSPQDKQHLLSDERNDIYSTAVVLWQLRSRVTHYALKESEELQIPDVTKMRDYPQAMQDLIVEAWNTDPAKRPSTLEMVHRIEVILQSHKATELYVHE